MSTPTPPPPPGSPYPPPGSSYPPYAAGVTAYPAPMANGLGVAGLVCGIVALVLCWTVIGGVVLGILGLVFGIIGHRRAQRGEANNGGMALAGAITGGLGLVLAILLVAVGVSVLNHARTQLNRYSTCVNHATTLAQENACARYLNR